MASRFGRPPGGRRLAVYRVIFESDTPAGRAFDIALVWVILASVAVVVVDSFPTLSARWGATLDLLEWFFTVLFTAEYISRLWCVQRPARYARSIFGIVDLLAVLPTWAALFLPGMSALINVRLLRLLRVFRILRLAAYVQEYRALYDAISASRRKIMVFLSFVLLVVSVMGTIMYVVEGPENGFSNVPVSIYWAISTMTTVGFGDITPKTGLGRFIASVMMLIGWGTLAVPTGIVSAEFTALRFAGGARGRERVCGGCGSADHTPIARFCQHCGAPLPAR
ncbi:MAG TPA: ion transporter [Caldimonas sp.]|nr:ion transporter [Caldimonas sp.]